jgi:hypothetical protein
MNPFPEKRWYLYDDTNGNIRLKHPYWPKIKVKCPYCNKLLTVENYKAQCCGKIFKTGFWEIHQIEPIGKHNKTSGRGWDSLRPFIKESHEPLLFH